MSISKKQKDAGSLYLCGAIMAAGAAITVGNVENEVSWLYSTYFWFTTFGACISAVTMFTLHLSSPEDRKDVKRRQREARSPYYMLIPVFLALGYLLWYGDGYRLLGVQISVGLMVFSVVLRVFVAHRISRQVVDEL